MEDSPSGDGESSSILHLSMEEPSVCEAGGHLGWAYGELLEGIPAHRSMFEVRCAEHIVRHGRQG